MTTTTTTTDAASQIIGEMFSKPLTRCIVSRKIERTFGFDAGVAFSKCGHFYFAAYTPSTGTVLVKCSRTFDADGVVDGYDGGTVVKQVKGKRAAKALATRMNRSAQG